MSKSIIIIKSKITKWDRFWAKLLGHELWQVSKKKQMEWVKKFK